MQDNPTTETMKTDVLSNGNGFLRFCALSYGIYALLMLMESLDFAALLHSPPEGFHATYDAVHVLFYIIEFAACAGFALFLTILLLSSWRNFLTVGIIVLILTAVRAYMIYYLYIYTDADHFVPFIYKKANLLSGVYRFVFLSLQVFSGILCGWKFLRRKDVGKRLKVQGFGNKEF